MSAAEVKVESQEPTQPVRTEFIIATRKSKLALVQANLVRDQLIELYPQYTFTIKAYDTLGDRVLDVALSKIGDKGLFTHELEIDLKEGTADLAVHSLKDVATKLPEGLIVGAITKREKPVDVVVGKPLKDAKIVGTSSLRRQAQLSGYKFVDVRGNLDTRLRKLKEGVCDSLILAHAGLARQGYDHHITEELNDMYYAVGQGALGLECREDDELVCEMLSKLNHDETALCCLAERGFMWRLEGGCHAPIGVRTHIKDEMITLEGFVSSLDGSKTAKGTIQGKLTNTWDLGVKLAEQLISEGADKILEELSSK